MAELPLPIRLVAAPPAPTRFPPVEFAVDGRSLQLRRLDAQAEVDMAREQNIAARHVLLAVRRGGDNGPARAEADRASAVLRAAVDVLTGLSDSDDAAARLDVDVDVDGAISVVRPHGELDLFTSPRLEEVCAGRLDDGEVELMVIDLSAVTFLDSSALAVMVEIHRVCTLNETRFALTGPSTRTRRLLSVTRLDTVLDVI